MFFDPQPPHEQQPVPALVRPAESSEARAVRQHSAEFLRELRGGATAVIEKRAAIVLHALSRAESDIIDTRAELAQLTVFEYFSPIGAALSRQVEIEERLIAAFKRQQGQVSKIRETLSKAEECIASGRFAESVPLLKQVREASHGTFPSQALIERIQRSAGPGAQ